MLPKEYFELFIKNKQTYEVHDDIEDPLFAELDPNEMETDQFVYSNDWECELLINDFIEVTGLFQMNELFVGKLANSYPNCYTIKDSVIEGNLICFTSGLSENSFLVAMYDVLSNLIESGSLEGKQYKLYKRILENDIIRRIEEEYGGAIMPGKWLHYAECLMKEDIRDIQSLAIRISGIMDYFVLLHEISHYILQGTRKRSLERTILVVTTRDVYFHLCEDHPIYYDMPNEEIMADICALFLCSKTLPMEEEDIIALLLAVLQLKKMSPEDVYTNEYRMMVIFYYLSKYCETFLMNQDKIKKEIQNVSRLFEYVDNKDLESESCQVLLRLMELYDYPKEVILSMLRGRFDRLEKYRDDIVDKGEYIDFSE